jgi:PglZ domain
MGVIVNELRQLLDRHLTDHGIVLWFDPEQHYERALEGLAIPGSKVLRFERSFYELRDEAEPLLRGMEVPRLLVYLPVEYETARMPLAELISYGTIVRPGEKGLANTRLAVVARRALKGLVPETRLDRLDKEIEQNKLTLAELEDLALGGGEMHLPTVLGVIYDTQHVQDATLGFLSRSDCDGELVSKNACAELTEMLQRSFGAPVTSGKLPGEMRSTLARHILSAEFLAALGDQIPESLKPVAIPKEPAVTERCVELARDWRNRLDLGASYAEAAGRVEQSLHLAAMSFPFPALARCETFSATEHELLREVANRLALGPNAELDIIARQRRNGFWALRKPDQKALWDLLLQAAELARVCDELDGALKASPSAAAIADAYVASERPWCRLDTLHRHLEKKASSLEFLLKDQPEEIERLVSATRQRYAATAAQIAEAFVRGLVTSNFELPGWYRQTQIFERAVAPQLGNRPVAYLLVDSLRYELARELEELLAVEFEIEREAVTGMLPGVTEVGMAALLPYAHGLKIRAGKKDELEVALGEALLRNRDDRIAYIEKHAGVPVVALKLEDPKQFKTKLKNTGKGPALVVVTSREIDRAGEEGFTDARQIMDGVVRHLRFALHLLAGAGIEHFVVAADHGHLFGDELAESEKIDPPRGRTVLLHRRVWVGEGGAASESYLRTTLAKLGIESELEVAVPWNLTAFRAPGSETYFHGGLSPQEFLLPVLKLRLKARVESVNKINWEMKLGSAKITTMHVTVTISGQGGLFAAEFPPVRVEVRSGSELCSMPVSATYGFSDTTGEVALRGQSARPNEVEPNSVTLMLTPKAPRSGHVSIHLLDAVSGVELKKLDPVEVSRVF